MTKASVRLGAVLGLAMLVAVTMLAPKPSYAASGIFGDLESGGLGNLVVLDSLFNNNGGSLFGNNNSSLGNLLLLNELFNNNSTNGTLANSGIGNLVVLDQLFKNNGVLSGNNNFARLYLYEQLLGSHSSDGMNSSSSSANSADTSSDQNSMNTSEQDTSSSTTGNNY